MISLTLNLISLFVELMHSATAHLSSALTTSSTSRYTEWPGAHHYSPRWPTSLVDTMKKSFSWK